MADPNVLVPDGQGTDRRAVLVNNVEGTVIFQENERSCNAMVDVDGELHRVVLVYDLSGGGGGGGSTIISTTAVLDSSAWDNNSQTITVNRVTDNNIVMVSPAPNSTSDWSNAGILCTAQSTNSLTFTCSSTPNTNVLVNVIIFN